MEKIVIQDTESDSESTTNNAQFQEDLKNIEKGVKTLKSKQTYQEIHEKARQRVLYEASLKYWKIRMEEEGAETIAHAMDNPNDPNDPSNYNGNEYRTVDEVLWSHDNYTKLTTDEVYALSITISPKPGDATPTTLLASANAWAKVNKKTGLLRKGADYMIWAVEQGSENVERLEPEKPDDTWGYHPHIHILIRLDRDSSDSKGKRIQQSQPAFLKREAQKFFREFAPKEGIQNKWFRCDMISKDDIPKVIRYIKGIKKSQKKDKKCQVDRIWRKEEGFEQFYERINKGSHPPLGSDPQSRSNNSEEIRPAKVGRKKIQMSDSDSD